MKKVFKFLLVFIVAAVAGGGTGFLLKKLIADPIITYDNVDFFSLTPDYDAIFNKVDSYKGSEPKIDAFSTSDILNYSMEKFRREETSSNYTVGYSDTGVVWQDIRGCCIKNGNEVFEESISKSKKATININIEVGNRMYSKGKGQDITMYTANKNSVSILDDGTDAIYSESAFEVYKEDAYKQKFGKTIYEMFIVLICPQSILSDEIKTTSTGYEITVDVDKDIGTYFDKLQMKNISNLDRYPVFKDMKVTFTLDTNLNLKKMHIDEHYTATKMVEAKAHSIIDIYYYANDNLAIPGLNDRVIYKLGD